MTHRDVEKHCAIGPDAQLLLSQAFRALKMSARSHDRILKVARTIADLDLSPEIRAEHLAEALQYRSMDREA